jgi:hypothetical protein
LLRRADSGAARRWARLGAAASQVGDARPVGAAVGDGCQGPLWDSVTIATAVFYGETSRFPSAHAARVSAKSRSVLLRALLGTRFDRVA